MGYPTRLLSDGEVIERQFRPHWSGILREGLIILVGIALVVVLAIIGVDTWVYAVVAGLVVILITRGLVRWATTNHVITNERLIYRAGWIAKQGTELPLEVIQNVAFNQTIFERVFRTGDLMIESAGTHGQTRYKDIPNPEGVQSLIYRVREMRMHHIEGGTSVPESSTSEGGAAGPGQAAPSSGETTAAQLETLARLHDEGKLTDAEFENEKAKLLGGS
jgi:membrane protein YdbS with pleckstrin-like domain